MSEIACVTGASGGIGREIVSLLLQKDVQVRALVRSAHSFPASVEQHIGSLGDQDVLSRFFKNATYVFHCAGEIHDELIMHKVNVDGTKNVYNAARVSGIRFFCHLSSAGVTGVTEAKIIDEDTPCFPQNIYEQTKYASEQIVSQKIEGCTTVILRPVNVVSGHRLGILSPMFRASLLDFVGAMIKGRERTHLIHARHVAEVAVFFMSKLFFDAEIFIVGLKLDHDDTVCRVWRLIQNKRPLSLLRMPFTLPLFFPYLIRRARGIRSNFGDVRYSSDKLWKMMGESDWTVSRTIDHIFKEI